MPSYLLSDLDPVDKIFDVEYFGVTDVPEFLCLPYPTEMELDYQFYVHPKRRCERLKRLAELHHQILNPST